MHLLAPARGNMRAACSHEGEHCSSLYLLTSRFLHPPAHVLLSILSWLEGEVGQPRGKVGAVLPRAAGYFQKHAALLAAACCAAAVCACCSAAAAAAAICQVLFQRSEDWLLVAAGGSGWGEVLS